MASPPGRWSGLMAPCSPSHCRRKGDFPETPLRRRVRCRLAWFSDMIISDNSCTPRWPAALLFKHSLQFRWTLSLWWKLQVCFQNVRSAIQLDARSGIVAPCHLFSLSDHRGRRQDCWYVKPRGCGTLLFLGITQSRSVSCEEDEEVFTHGIHKKNS